MIFLRLLFVIALFMSSWLKGEDNFTEAQMAFQAGDYLKAGKIFEALAEMESDEWRKTVLKYDAGLVLMAQGKWSEAIAHFQSIPIEEPINPLIESHIYNNIAISLYELGRSYSGAAKVELSLFVYEEALSYIKDAQESYCRLQRAEGAKDCIYSTELQRLKAETEKAIAALPALPASPDIKKGVTAKEFLVYLIQQQRLAIVALRKKESVAQAQEALAMQRKIIEEAGAMFTLAYEDSKKGFMDLNETDPEKRCQAHPWDEFYPAFERGLKSAESSIAMKGRKQLYKQAEAYFIWQNALKILEKPKDEFTGKCPQSSEEQKKVDKTFEKLQEMEQQDRPQQRQQQLQNQGVQPW